MKYVLILSILLSNISLFSQSANDVGKIALHVVLPEEYSPNFENLGPRELKKIKSKIGSITSKNGVAGVGMGNLKDSKLQILAKKGNGNYAYLDDIKEAERVLVKEISQNLYAVADDVFMNVKFNPNMISRYKLLGFDNKKEAL